MSQRKQSTMFTNIANLTKALFWPQVLFSVSLILLILRSTDQCSSVCILLNRIAGLFKKNRISCFPQAAKLAARRLFSRTREGSNKRSDYKELFRFFVNVMERLFPQTVWTHLGVLLTVMEKQLTLRSLKRAGVCG